MIFEKKCSSNKERLIFILVSGAFWYLFAHGYRMANNMFAHDSLLQIVGNDSAWQIALGRFMQPFLLMLRGGISNPWLISICALIELLGAAYLLIDLLKIERHLSIFLTLGIMMCNPILVAANASFVSWLDFYALSLMLSVLGVWLWEQKNIIHRCLAVGCMVISMGIYQAYICVSIGLFIILIVEQLKDEYNFKEFLKESALKCLGLILAGGLYYVAWTVIRKALHIWAANTYNGLDGVLSFENAGLGKILLITYKGVLDFFWNPNAFYTVVFREQSLSFVWLWILRFANVLVVLSLLYNIISNWRYKKVDLWQKVVQLLLLLILPAGVNFVCILSKGMVHSLMIYAYLLIYIWALKAVGCYEISVKRLVSLTVIIAVSLCVWAQVVWGNQVYLKVDMQDRANSSFISMLVYDIEHSDNYKPGVTRVALAGTIEKSPYISDIESFESIYSYGLGKTTTTYMGTEASFIKYNINVPINLEYTPMEGEVLDMPVYPESGSIRYIDDVLVVRLSE